MKSLQLIAGLSAVLFGSVFQGHSVAETCDGGDKRQLLLSHSMLEEEVTITPSKTSFVAYKTYTIENAWKSSWFDIGKRETISKTQLLMLQALERLGMVRLDLKDNGNFEGGMRSMFELSIGKLGQVTVSETAAGKAYSDKEGFRIVAGKSYSRKIVKLKFIEDNVDEFALVYVETTSVRSPLGENLFRQLQQDVSTIPTVPPCLKVDLSTPGNLGKILFRWDDFKCQWKIEATDSSLSKQGVFCSNSVDQAVERLR